ncbi:MAG: OmpA family protein [Archangium sp.]|nr:OmpA family protein [Archangium sp.]
MRNVSPILFAVAVLSLTACPPTYPNCKSDENCTEKGEVCVQGQCHECATDENCKAGFVCDKGSFTCVPKPECTGDTGCGPGKKCKQGKCAVAKEPGSCLSNDDCASGQECKAGKCAALPVEAAAACTYEPVRFEFNEHVLSASSQSALAAVADCIKKGGLKFTLEGHADERGTEEYNMVLSQKRAASVRKYLVDLGVGASALDTVGYGENRPVSDAHDDAGWAANRRVDFRKR